jgi:hypothetical protein
MGRYLSYPVGYDGREKRGGKKMDDLSPSDSKTILHSKRANMYYLEHCRVMPKDGRVLYLTEAKKDNLYFNIPIANTTVILLGTGTSITQAAVRMPAQAGGNAMLSPHPVNGYEYSTVPGRFHVCFGERRR